MTVLELVTDSKNDLQETDHIHGEINPKIDSKTVLKESDAKSQGLEVGQKFIRILSTVRPIGKVTAIETDSTTGKKVRFTWENLKKDEATKGGLALFDDCDKTWRIAHPNELDIKERKIERVQQV